MQEFVDKFRYNAKRASLVQSRLTAIEKLVRAPVAPRGQLFNGTVNRSLYGVRTLPGIFGVVPVVVISAARFKWWKTVKSCEAAVGGV